jgi:hypothetical protein
MNGLAREPLTTMTDQAADTDRFSHDAGILAQALPYMQRYEGKTVVVKYGGHAMGDLKLGQAFARDIALLKQSKVNPIVVHGGGPQIASMLKNLGIESKFEGGLRVTDKRTMEIVEMVLAGSINKEIVALINAEGEWAIGLCGKDGNMVFARKAEKKVIDPTSNIERVLDLGFVGEPVEVDRTLLDLLARSEMIPVIAPGPRPRRQYLQYQCRYLCRRHCWLTRRQAPLVPDRRARRARPGWQAYFRTHRARRQGPDRRRHHFRWHDSQGRDLP